MKMTDTHYQQLKTEIECIPRDKALAHRQALSHDWKVKDFNKRFRWDLFNQAVPTKWVCDVLYSYLNDAHIDTALRQIMKELEYV